MKQKEITVMPSIAESEPDKTKKSRARSPGLTTRTRQNYLQNLEKQLDEIMTGGTEAKKLEKKANTMSVASGGGTTKNLQAVKSLPSLKAHQGDKAKKVRMCKMFQALRVCRNGDDCPFAHSINQLDVDYKPKEWVKIFTHNVHRVQNQRPATTLYTFKKVDTNINIKTPGSKDTEIVEEPEQYNIDKVINTVLKYLYCLNLQKGRTLLIQAAVMNDLDNVRVLVKSGAQVSQRDWLGNDSIFYAIKNSNSSMVEALIRLSHDTLNLDERFTVARQNYLIFASKISNIRILEILLSNGADPNVLDKTNKSALFYCVENNFIRGAELLIKNGADYQRPDIFHKTVMDYAYDKNLIDMMDFLIRVGAVTNDPAKNKSLILICCQYNLKQAVNDLIKRGMSTAEVDKEGNTLLMVAYENGHMDLLESLINSYGLGHILNTFNKRKDNLLLRVIKDQNHYLTQFLLNLRDIEYDTKDETIKTILMYAAESGDYKTVDFLLKKNLDPDAIDKYGRTALIFACKNDHILTVETLLKYPVSVLWKDYVGKRAKDYTKNKTIHNLLKHYMMEHPPMSDSLIKGGIQLEEEKYNIKKLLEAN